MLFLEFLTIREGPFTFVELQFPYNEVVIQQFKLCVLVLRGFEGFMILSSVMHQQSFQRSKHFIAASSASFTISRRTCKHCLINSRRLGLKRSTNSLSMIENAAFSPESVQRSRKATWQLSCVPAMHFTIV